jgi:hypothetical protein
MPLKSLSLKPMSKQRVQWSLEERKLIVRYAAESMRSHWPHIYSTADLPRRSGGNGSHEMSLWVSANAKLPPHRQRSLPARGSPGAYIIPEMRDALNKEVDILSRQFKPSLPTQVMAPVEKLEKAPEKVEPEKVEPELPPPPVAGGVIMTLTATEADQVRAYRTLLTFEQRLADLEAGLEIVMETLELHGQRLSGAKTSSPEHSAQLASVKESLTTLQANLSALEASDQRPEPDVVFVPRGTYRRPTIAILGLQNSAEFQRLTEMVEGADLVRIDTDKSPVNFSADYAVVRRCVHHSWFEKARQCVGKDNAVFCRGGGSATLIVTRQFVERFKAKLPKTT